MFTLSKFFSVAPLELPTIPAVKTVDSVISSFTQVLEDLQEVQTKAIDNIAYATNTIKAYQDDIAANTLESERAKSIITKIEGLLK